MSDPIGAAAARPDACPGALRPHHAADGALVRIRLPGGRITAHGLRVLADAAGRWGNGHLDLTGRGNLQLRGLDPEILGRLAEVLRAAGLLPSVVHERARNIIASPLTGLDEAGRLDVTHLVTELDQRLCAEKALAGLGGRFLFALDDGRSDVVGLRADVTWCARDRSGGTVSLAGQETGLWTTAAVAPRVLLAAARAFLDLRGGDPAVWRVRDLPGGGAALAARLRTGAASRWVATAPDVPEATIPPRRAAPPTTGVVTRDGRQTARVVAPPLGRLSPAQAHVLADAAAAGAPVPPTAATDGDTPATAGRQLVLTPWRDVVVPGAGAGTEERLRAAGLVTSADSPWQGVSACVGSSGCAKSRADVRADATRLVYRRSGGANRRRVHWSGCGRRCGSPNEPHLAVVASATDTYQIDATAVGIPAEDAPARVARALEDQ